MSNKSKVCWNTTYYGVEIDVGNKHFVISAMPNMIGRLDAAVKCCETMGNWRLPTYKEIELVAHLLPHINALMGQNGGHPIDLESILWLSGDYGSSTGLKTGEGLCYILQYRMDTLSWWWNRREIRLVMPVEASGLK
jgi:hypothetical protein